MAKFSSSLMTANLSVFPLLDVPKIPQVCQFSSARPSGVVISELAMLGVSFRIAQTNVVFVLFCLYIFCSSGQFKIGICQLTVTDDKSHNLVKARNSIQSAAKQGASLILLPEMWNCPYSHDYFSKFAEDFDDKDGSPTFSMLSQVASSLAVTVIGGSIPERSAKRLYNTCCAFGPDGKLKAKYRKMHLFDINLPGNTSFKESDSFSAGEQPKIVDTDVGRVGIGICHDIRFPELSMLYRDGGAHLICFPGAFNMSTGELLWELAQRARAADNQLYVATCSPSRESAGSYTIWGHSTLVGPLGQIIATSGYEETILIGDVDYAAIQQTRESLPLDKQRRQDVYKLIDLHKHCTKGTE